MANIMFNTVGDPSGAYVLPRNPYILDLNDGGDFSPFAVLDDGPVIQQHAFDGRIRKMTWQGGKASDPVITAQNAVLRAYKSTVRYILFGDAYYGDATYSATWFKHRIVDFQTNIRPGGVVRYESIELLFVLEA